jgi:hypothetical protein
MEELAGNAPRPVPTGSQDFRTGRHCHLSPIQLTVETIIVVEDGHEQRKLDKKAETRTIMDVSPRWKDAPSGAFVPFPGCLKGRGTALRCIWLRRTVIFACTRMKICGVPPFRQEKAKGWGTELCGVGQRRKCRSSDPLCSLGVTALFVMARSRFPTLATGKSRKDGARSFVGLASELVVAPSTCFDPVAGINIY